MEVEVIFPYEPQHEDELRLAVGDKISGVTPLEAGWFKGTLGDATGVFPDNFVKVLSKEPKNGSTDTNLTSTSNVPKREMGGRRCRVVFSYAPQHDDELSLCVGQTIEVLQEVEEGWWKGVLDGQVGMFPSNFVECVEEEESETKQPESNSLENINNQLNINGEGKEIKPKPIQGMGYGVKLADLKKDGTKKEAEGPTSNGSPKILGSSGSSAFQPVSKNKEPPKENGQVKDFRELPHRLPPALEPKADKVTSKVDKTRINSADKERINSLEKDRITITIGEEKTKGEAASRLPLPSASPSQLSPPPQLPPKPVRELARVMFPYTAEHEDELELKEGDIITVLCKELEDKGWWRGELNSQIGVFPDNFVELISPEETAKPPRPEKPSTAVGKKGSPTSSTDTTPTGTLNKTDKEPPPPLPEKKVQPPPPPEKKPLPTPYPDAHDGGSSSKEPLDVAMPKLVKRKIENKEDLSLTLDTDGEPLKHVTHLRPKGPSRRRPPSGVFKENMKNSADSDSHLPPTPEDGLDNDSNHQLNGHVSTTELPRSPSVSSVSPIPPKPMLRPESSPQSDAGNSVPWLQELHLKQKKRLSGIMIDGESPVAPPPAVSPKPTGMAPKTEDKPVPRPPRPSLPMNEAINSNIKRPVEPSLPTPDYETKAPVTHSVTPITKNKPLPQTPLAGVQPEKRLGLTPDQRTPTVEAKIPISTRESKKPSSAPETPSNLEEKIDVLYKDLLPKMKLMEERMEDQKKDYSRKIQMLMSELDEERKRRACMEVEIERLKKLVNAYAQVTTR